MKQENRMIKPIMVKPKLRHVDKVWAMYQRGATFAEIAKKLGMTMANAHRIVADSGLPSRNPRGCCMSGACEYAKQYGCRGNEKNIKGLV